MEDLLDSGHNSKLPMLLGWQRSDESAQLLHKLYLSLESHVENDDPKSFIKISKLVDALLESSLRCAKDDQLTIRLGFLLVRELTEKCLPLLFRRCQSMRALHHLVSVRHKLLHDMELAFNG